MNFIDLLRFPNNYKLQCDHTPLRFEELPENGGVADMDSRVSFEVTDRSLRVILSPGGDPVQWLRLRFRGTIPQKSDTSVSILGDAVERVGGDEINWSGFRPHVLMPWYIHIFDGKRLDCYGVKTGGNSFAFWQCDPSGLTLWLDVRNGSEGVHLQEPLVCAEIVCRKGLETETPYAAAQDFCRQMCPRPNLPAVPVYGFNNWYWAYGGIDRKTVLREAASLSALTDGCEAKPFMVIDDGWQFAHSKGYNGGPWNACNEAFCASNLSGRAVIPDDLSESANGMAETAAEIRERGCRPGIWLRPLLTMSHVPSEAVYQSPSVPFGTVMDPSHPFTLEKVAADISRIAGWGYELIKHDFTTYDLYGAIVVKAAPMYDCTKTNAQIIRNLYHTIQNAAGNAVILGCNVVGHLSAGIHQSQRVGADTSGRSFEWTRRDGIHSMMRLPQNGTFFSVDPDCAAFTERVPKDLNFDFLEASAITGCAVFASVKPGILTDSEEKRLNGILKIASAAGTPGVPLDWSYTNAPEWYLYNGNEYRYDWYKSYDGTRNVLTWME